VLRTWLVIPIVAAVSAAIAMAMHRAPIEAVACAGMGAAVAASVRSLAGTTVSVAVAAGVGALLAVLEVLPLGSARGALAGGCALFAVAELARLVPPRSPYPAIGAAVVAGVIDPSYAPLVMIAGVQLLYGPWHRPRWAAVVPAAGAAIVLIALLASAAHHGLLASLWRAWTGTTAQHHAASTTIIALGSELGPLVVVTATCGLAVCASRGKLAAATVLSIAVTSLLVSMRAGHVTPAPLIVASLSAGAGIARLSSLVRWPAGQAFVGATAGFMLLLAPGLSGL
jgi:hypothetical protein